MKDKKSLVIILSILILSCSITSGQVADTLDTSMEKPKKIFVNSFLAPTILIAAGVATMYDRGWYSSYDAYECIQENYPDFHSNLDDYLVFLPAAGVYGLNWAGVKGKNNFIDRSLIYLVSVSLAAATNAIIKGSTDVLRPDGSDYNSFPSNHTALAFVSATFLHMEYKDQSIWYGIAGYSIATATGVLRMLNNKHWMSDVLVGAGIG
ncbi:MAG: phosphatase PAP2 family protein, partial [Cyclobacteriaceae bacterium]|nr:phosphatase PAP2 family protein [Cyclobacteriaceae bacterium]